MELQDKIQGQSTDSVLCGIIGFMSIVILNLAYFGVGILLFASTISESYTELDYVMKILILIWVYDSMYWFRERIMKIVKLFLIY